MIPSPFTAIPASIARFFALFFALASVMVFALAFALSASAQQTRLADPAPGSDWPGITWPDPAPGITWVAGSAIEGGMILVRLAPGASLTLDGAPLPMTDDGHALIGFHRDSDTPIALVVRLRDGTRHSITLMAEQRDYAVQRIDGLKRDHVTPPKAVLDRIGADSAAVRAARTYSDAGAPAGDFAGDFLRGFDMPVTGRITGVYGSQRILNGEARQPHYGIDIAAPRGTPVIAPAGGRVTLVRDLYFSGWTVLMAHGLGLNSAFLHLDSVTVTEGEAVERGAVIGTVGSTGRSTGPHLDWRLDWQGRRLDAALVRRQLAGLTAE